MTKRIPYVEFCLAIAAIGIGTSQEKVFGASVAAFASGIQMIMSFRWAMGATLDLNIVLEAVPATWTIFGVMPVVLLSIVAGADPIRTTLALYSLILILFGVTFLSYRNIRAMDNCHFKSQQTGVVLFGFLWTSSYFWHIDDTMRKSFLWLLVVVIPPSLRCWIQCASMVRLHLAVLALYVVFIVWQTSSALVGRWEHELSPAALTLSGNVIMKRGEPGLSKKQSIALWVGSVVIGMMVAATPSVLLKLRAYCRPRRANDSTQVESSHDSSEQTATSTPDVPMVPVGRTEVNLPTSQDVLETSSATNEVAADAFEQPTDDPGERSKVYKPDEVSSTDPLCQSSAEGTRDVAEADIIIHSKVNTMTGPLDIPLVDVMNGGQAGIV